MAQWQCLCACSPVVEYQMLRLGWRSVFASGRLECTHTLLLHASQSLQNIRTVVAYVGEEQTCKQYNAALAKPQKVPPRLILPDMATSPCRLGPQSEAVGHMSACCSVVPQRNLRLLCLLQVGTQASFVSGALLGFVFFIAFSAYALALWYGSVRIIAGAMNGGDVVTVRFYAVRPLGCHPRG